MPKKGKKKKNTKNKNFQNVKKSMIYKDDMQEYAKVTKILGDRRTIVILPDKIELLAIIPGRFRKRMWIKIHDVILVSRREFQDSRLDVIHRYSDDEIKKLAKDLEIPEFFLETNSEYNNDDCQIWECTENSENSEQSLYEKQPKISYEDITISSSTESEIDNSSDNESN